MPPIHSDVSLTFSCHSNSDPVSIMHGEDGRKKNQTINYTVCNVIICNCYNSRAGLYLFPRLVTTFTVTCFWSHCHWLHTAREAVWESTASLDKVVPVFDCPHGEEFLPLYPVITSHFNLRVLSHHSDEPGLSILITTSQVLEGCYFVPHKLSSSGFQLSRCNSSNQPPKITEALKELENWSKLRAVPSKF